MHWDEQAVNRVFGQGTANNWSPEMIRQQIINFYQPSGGAASLVGGGFDLNSIMMYSFPPGLATFDDGTPFQTPNNVALSPLDKVVASMLYPATGVTDPDETTCARRPPRFRLDRAGRSGRPLQVQAGPAAVHVVETQGTTRSWSRSW